MATFKVGQRVKYVSGLLSHLPVGAEGTVFRCDGRGYIVDFAPHKAISNCFGPTHFEVKPTSIVPLTDPRADEFIADMNRFAHISKTKVTQ